MFSLYLQNGPWNIVQNQHCIQLVFANCLKPAPNCTASSLCMSSWEYTWEYISLMGTHLERVWGIQLERTWTCGIHLEHIWNTLGTHLEYTWNTLGIHSEYTWNTLFSRHSCFFEFGAQVAGMDGEYSWNTSLNHWKNFRFWRTHLGYLFLGKWMSFYIWHTHRTWAGKEPFWNTLRSTFWTYKQHTLGTQKNILDISNVWLLWVVVTLRNQNIQSWRDTSPTHYENSTLWWNTNNCLVVSNVHIHRYNLVGGLEPVFSILYGIIIPTDFLIFHRGRYTTKQIYISSNSKRFFFVDWPCIYLGFTL